MTWLETTRAAPSPASWRNLAQRCGRNAGSSPTVGSSRTSAARWRQARSRVRRAPVRHRRACARAGRRAARAARSQAPPRRGSRRAQDPGEEAHVLADAQALVETAPQGHVADLGRGRPGAPAGSPEHPHRARFDDLDADDRPQQRRLARSARTEQTGHPARRDAERKAMEDLAGTPPHAQVLDLDRDARRALIAWRRPGTGWSPGPGSRRAGASRRRHPSAASPRARRAR